MLFSILANLWCRLLGVGDLAAALDRPAALRLLPFLLAAPGPILLGAAVRRRLGVGAGAVAAALFASALPFANFACQFRGYGLGLTLVSAMLLFAVRFKDSGRTRDLVPFAAAGALAVWAIPLHLYALAAVALLHGAMWTARMRRGVPTEARLSDLRLAAAAVAAAGLGLALYIPCTGSVLSNHWSEPKAGGPHLRTLTEVMPPVLAAMGAGRVWLLAALGGALVACWVRRGPGMDRAAAGLLAWGAGLALLPFVVSALRGDRPFDRVFLQVLPAFAIAGAAAVRLALGAWHARPWVAPIAVAALAVGGWLALDERDRRLAEDIEKGVKSQFIERAYFHAHYRPRAVASLLLRRDAALSSLQSSPRGTRSGSTAGVPDRGRCRVRAAQGSRRSCTTACSWRCGREANSQHAEFFEPSLTEKREWEGSEANSEQGGNPVALLRSDLPFREPHFPPAPPVTPAIDTPVSDTGVSPTRV